jgi:Asp-tRNA(Asn)/Glu-tRNA(Gln) amidotransferase A subunit family amidase
MARERPWPGIAKRLGRKALQDIACIAKPDTILAWYRKLVAQKFDGSKKRGLAGRPRVDAAIEELVAKLARENRACPSSVRAVLGAPPNQLPVAGPLSRTAEDLQLALEAVAGPDGPEAKALHYSMPKPRAANLKDFPVGVPPDDSWCPLSSEIRPCHERAISEIETAGAKVVRGWPEGFQPDAAFRVYSHVIRSVVDRPPAKEHEEEMRKAYEKDPRNPSLAVQFGPALEQRAMTLQVYVLRAVWERYFQTIDVFLSPVDFVPAFPHDHSSGDRQLQTPEGPRPVTPIRSAGYGSLQ